MLQISELVKIRAKYKKRPDAFFNDILRYFNPNASHYALFQQDLISYLLSNDYAQLMFFGARGCSKTSTPGIYIAYQMLMDPQIKVGIGAGKKDQAEKGLEYIKSMLEFPPLAASVDRILTDKILFKQGGFIKAIPYVPKASARSERFDISWVDEFVLASDKYIQGWRGCRLGNTKLHQLLLSSTPNKFDHITQEWFATYLNAQKKFDACTLDGITAEVDGMHVINDNIMKFMFVPSMKIEGHPYYVEWIDASIVEQEIYNLNLGTLDMHTFITDFLGYWHEETVAEINYESIAEALKQKRYIQVDEYDNKKVRKRQEMEEFDEFISVGIDWGGAGKKSYSTAIFCYWHNDPSKKLVEVLPCTVSLNGLEYDVFISDVMDTCIRLAQTYGVEIRIYSEASSMSGWQNNILEDQVYAQDTYEIQFDRVSLVKKKQHEMGRVTYMLNHAEIWIREPNEDLLNQIKNFNPDSNNDFLMGLVFALRPSDDLPSEMVTNPINWEESGAKVWTWESIQNFVKINPILHRRIMRRNLFEQIEE